MDVPNPQPERKRGKLLKAFLIVNFVGNPSVILFYLVAIIYPTLNQAVLSQSGLTPELNIVLIICQFVFAIAIWKWKKWGAYGFITIALVRLTISIATDSQNILKDTLFGILGIVFFIFLFRSVWRYME